MMSCISQNIASGQTHIWNRAPLGLLSILSGKAEEHPGHTSLPFLVGYLRSKQSLEFLPQIGSEKARTQQCTSIIEVPVNVQDIPGSWSNLSDSCSLLVVLV